MTDTGAELLAQAIVKQACVDWKKSMRILAKNPCNKDANIRKRDCERFFRSDFCYDLTGISGKDFLGRLRRTPL